MAITLYRNDDPDAEILEMVAWDDDEELNRHDEAYFTPENLGLLQKDDE